MASAIERDMGDVHEVHECKQVVNESLCKASV